MKQKSKRLIHQRLAGAVVTFLLMIWQFFPLQPLSHTLERLDGIIYDYRLNILPPWPESVTNIQIVDIDERSLHIHGRMPWPRKQFAELVKKLTDLGAITIAFDILFTEPEINPAESVLALLSDADSKSSVEIIAEQLDGDRHFATSFAENEVVLATLFHHDVDIRKGMMKSSTIVGSVANKSHKLHRFSGYSANTELIANPAVGQGFVNVVPDVDGFIRRAPLVVVNQGVAYPSLALEAFRSYSLADEVTLEWQQPEQSNMAAVHIGKSRIPTDNHGQLLIPFRSVPFYYSYTSAADILAGKIGDSRFNNAVVFVGTSAIGLADLRTTPVSINFPGVEIHATIFDALMSPESLPYRPDWWQGAVFVFLLFYALILTLILPRLGAISGELFALSILVLATGSNFLLWRWQAIDLPLTSILVLIFSLSGYFISYGYLSENKRRKQVKAVFDRYVSPAHIDEMLEQPQEMNLKGQKKFLTVLYADIRDFTKLSESLTPEQLSTWLNRVFSPLTSDIFTHKGTIDKYVGDMVMAFWGAPLSDERQASHAVATAFAMQASIEKLNKAFSAEGLPLVRIGIGINSGMMNVGDMGSEYRLSYTVLGDAVNLGSRIESLTKYYGVCLLMSEFTKNAAIKEPQSNWKEQDFLLIDKVNVKGKTVPITLYSPIPAVEGDLFKQQCYLFEQALALYFQTEFAQAKAYLNKLDESFVYKRLLALYLQRIETLIDKPLPIDWNGVYSHKQK